MIDYQANDAVQNRDYFHFLIQLLKYLMSQVYNNLVRTMMRDHH